MDEHAVVEQLAAADAADVYRAWTDADQLARWCPLIAQAATLAGISR